jgi:flagellar biosynthetic protein FlhB
MSETDQERRHPASTLKRLRAREDGHFPKSRDLTAGVMLVVGTGALAAIGPSITSALARSAAVCWSRVPTSAGDFAVLPLAELLTPVAMVGVVLLLAALGAELVQTGLFFSPGKLVPDFSRLAPWSGLKRCLGGGAFGRLGGGLARLAILGGLAAWIGWSLWPDHALSATHWPAWAMQLLTVAASCLVLLGALDYGIRWWRHEHQLKMTDQEVRDEAKDSGEGQSRPRAVTGVPAVNTTPDALADTPSRPRPQAGPLPP